VEAEQFIATNIYELAQFNAEKIQVKVNQLVEKYNAVVEVAKATNHSLSWRADFAMWLPNFKP